MLGDGYQRVLDEDVQVVNADLNQLLGKYYFSPPRGSPKRWKFKTGISAPRRYPIPSISANVDWSPSSSFYHNNQGEYDGERGNIVRSSMMRSIDVGIQSASVNDVSSDCASCHSYRQEIKEQRARLEELSLAFRHLGIRVEALHNNQSNNQITKELIEAVRRERERAMLAEEAVQELRSELLDTSASSEATIIGLQHELEEYQARTEYALKQMEQLRNAISTQLVEGGTKPQQDSRLPV